MITHLSIAIFVLFYIRGNFSFSTDVRESKGADFGETTDGSLSTAELNSTRYDNLFHFYNISQVF